jgi:hypothetical protein
MTKIKTLVAAMLIAASSASHAAGWSWNETFSSPVAPSVADITSLGNSGPYTVGNTYTDTITLGGLNAGTYSFSLGVAGLFFSDVVVTLNNAVATTSTAGPNGEFSFSWLNLQAPANPVLTFTGTATQTFASYTGSVSAVPEPHAIALAIAGLGLVGCMRRRRSEES